MRVQACWSFTFVFKQLSHKNTGALHNNLVGHQWKDFRKSKCEELEDTAALRNHSMMFHVSSRFYPSFLNVYISACVWLSQAACVCVSLSVCIVACCIFEVWAAALVLLMISCFHIPVIADLDSPLSAPADQPSAATGLAQAFLIHFQHTHPCCLLFPHTRPPFRFHCLEMDFKEAACSQSQRDSFFNKACQVWFLAGRG